MLNKFQSRKFIITLLVIATTIGLALAKVMDGDVALILSAAIGSYNVMQGLVDKNGPS